MMMGLPSVSLRKRLRSEGSRQGSWPSRPMTPFSASGDDEGDADLAGHTATAALMCGCGS